MTIRPQEREIPGGGTRDCISSVVVGIIPVGKPGIQEWYGKTDGEVSLQLSVKVARRFPS
jgi:hypothetical protein